MFANEAGRYLIFPPSLAHAGLFLLSLIHSIIPFQQPGPLSHPPLFPTLSFLTTAVKLQRGGGGGGLKVSSSLDWELQLVIHHICKPRDPISPVRMNICTNVEEHADDNKTHTSYSIYQTCTQSKAQTDKQAVLLINSLCPFFVYSAVSIFFYFFLFPLSLSFSVSLLSSPISLIKVHTCI